MMHVSSRSFPMILRIKFVWPRSFESCGIAHHAESLADQQYLSDIIHYPAVRDGDRLIAHLRRILLLWSSKGLTAHLWLGNATN